MKKFIAIFSSAMLMLSSCVKPGTEANKDNGTLSLGQITLNYDVEMTKSSVEEEIYLFICNADDEVVKQMTYSEYLSLQEKISLKAGKYMLYARSTMESVPDVAFDAPVYGASEPFTIVAGKETVIENLICKLLQVKVSISYSEDLLAGLQGDATTTVSVITGTELRYELQYNEGAPVYEQRPGYFAVNSSDATMIVTFKGTIGGKNGKITKTYVNIKPAQWYRIEIVKKVSNEGNADFTISVDDLIEDEELKNNIDAQEENLGDDPHAPAGDGGIELISTCAYDITQPVIVPEASEPFIMTMKAVVPGKVKKFTVEIDSTSDVFKGAVGDINDGSNILDLVHPSEGAKAVFTEILPFPYGEAVADKEEIEFNLSDAQAPLLAFKGTHTFIMHVVDHNGCKKDISIDLVVE